MKSALKYLDEIFFIIGDDRKKLPWIMILILISSSLDLMGLGLIGPYVSILIDPTFFDSYPDDSPLKNIIPFVQREKIIMFLSSLLAIVFLIKTVFVILIKKIIIHFSYSQKKNIQTYLMKAYQNQPYTNYISRNSSEYIQTINGLVNQFTNGVLQQLLTIFTEGIIGVVIILFLAYTNANVLFFLIMFLGGSMFIYDRLFRSNLQKYGELGAAGEIQVIKATQEGMLGMKEIRVLGKSSYFEKKVAEGARLLRTIAIKTTLIGTAPRYLLEFILITFFVTLVTVSFSLGKNIQTVGAMLGVFGIAALRLIPSATVLSGSLITFRHGRYSTSKLFEDIKLYKNQGFSSVPILGKELRGKDLFRNLELNDLFFRYPNEKNWTLSKINLKINSGESIGLIGPSGTGKTTIIDIILGLLIPQKGQILYNGFDLQEYLEKWYAQVAYLPQEIFLTDDNLRNNVALGFTNDEIDESRVHDSLRQARLKELINQLPDGIDTMIGENGVRLSGGQKQRVAIARAFYHKRNIMIMDESTSSLDSETEKEVVNEIQNLKGEKTLIVIAHRYSTVEQCDLIYRMDQGMIIDSGSYQQVIGKGEK